MKTAVKIYLCVALIVLGAELRPAQPPAAASVKPAALAAIADQPASAVPAAAPKSGQLWENSLGMKFVPVPGVEVLFGVWDVRVQDYQAFADDTKRDWPKPTFAQGPTHPAVNVSWEDAKAFCVWLTHKERATGKLGPNQSYRLPMDWEWSVAVGLNEPRDGTPKDKHAKIKNVYPWGTVWPPPIGAGNYITGLKVDDFDCTSPVGSFAANKLGLYDMGGNVWQWCEDHYGDQNYRVLRGASFGSGLVPDYLLSSTRNDGRVANTRVGGLGFRCVVAFGTSTP
jgi:formylglycine-generating enzyme required for sulfatase activity